MHEHDRSLCSQHCFVPQKQKTILLEQFNKYKTSAAAHVSQSDQLVWAQQRHKKKKLLIKKLKNKQTKKSHKKGLLNFLQFCGALFVEIPAWLEHS